MRRGYSCHIYIITDHQKLLVERHTERVEEIRILDIVIFDFFFIEHYHQPVFDLGQFFFADYVLWFIALESKLNIVLIQICSQCYFEFNGPSFVPIPFLQNKNTSTVGGSSKIRCLCSTKYS
jgi:hypothetical protein